MFRRPSVCAERRRDQRLFPEAGGVDALRTKRGKGADDGGKILVIGHAVPDLGAGEHPHPRGSGLKLVVDDVRKIQLAFFRVFREGFVEEMRELRPDLIEKTRREAEKFIETSVSPESGTNVLSSSV